MFYLRMRELVTCMGIFAHYFENKERYPAWLSALNYKAQSGMQLPDEKKRGNFFETHNGTLKSVEVFYALRFIVSM